MIPNHILESVSDIKKLRRQIMFLNLKNLLIIHRTYLEILRLKKSNPEIYLDYMENREEFWKSFKNSRSSLFKSLREECKEFSSSLKWKFYGFLFKYRKK